jgi:methionyl-tRNA formyltransferase
MAEGLDTGPILSQRATAIGPTETAAELSTRLAELGAQLLVQTVPGWLAGALAAQEQGDEGVTFAPLVHKGDGIVDWREPAAVLARRLRAYTPWPGLTATLGGAPVRLLAANAADAAGSDGAPGSIVAVSQEAVMVVAGGGSVLAVSLLQRPGRKAQTGRDFANGERLAPNAHFEVA